MPDLSLMQCICRELDISISELLNGERNNDTQARTDMDIKNNVSQIVKMVDREKSRKAEKLSWCFGVGLLTLLAVIATGEMLGQTQKWVLTCLGVGIQLAGLCYNAQDIGKKSFSEPELAILAGLDKNVPLKTAEQMLSFSRKSQRAELIQYKHAFQKIEMDLKEDEYAVFAMVGNSCKAGNNPELWHVAVVATHNRLLICGEMMRGMLMTSYVIDYYELSDIKNLSLSNHKMVICTDRLQIQIEAENADQILKQMKNILSLE